MTVVLPLGLLAIVLLNVVVWRRPHPIVGEVRDVVVVIPARNEAARIGPTLAAARDQAPVVVLDDQSTDGTAAVARDAGATVLGGTPLPAGWAGKVWAMDQLMRGTEEPVLLFLDADVVLQPGAVASIRAELATCDVLTAVPRQRAVSWAERVLMPLMHLAYVAWLPLPLVEHTRDPRFLAANGQVLAMRRRTLERLGGWSAVRSELVDDMAIGRLAKRSGLRVRFADGHALAETRMYAGGVEVIEGFSKNIYEGLGSVFLLALVLVLHLVAFVVPYAVLAYAVVEQVAVGTSAWWGEALVGVGANVLLRGMMAVRYGHSWVSVVLHPLAVLVLCGVALRSWWLSIHHRVQWAGRTYAHFADR